jgi:hypothetical protein
MASRLNGPRAGLEEVRVERDNLRLDCFLRVGCGSLKRRVALAISGNIEPPPGIIRSGASCFDLARERPSILYELETSDHRCSSRVNCNVLKFTLGRVAAAVALHAIDARARYIESGEPNGNLRPCMWLASEHDIVEG